MHVGLVPVLLTFLVYKQATCVPVEWINRIQDRFWSSPSFQYRPPTPAPVFAVEDGGKSTTAKAEQIKKQTASSTARRPSGVVTADGVWPYLALPQPAKKYRLPPKPSRYHKAKVAHHAKYGVMKTAEAVAALPLHLGAGIVAAALAPFRAGREAISGQSRQAGQTLKHGVIAPFAGAATGTIDTLRHSFVAAQDFGRVIKHGAAFPISKARDKVFGEPMGAHSDKYIYKLERAKRKRRKMEQGAFDDEVAHIGQLSGSGIRAQDVKVWRLTHKLFEYSKLQKSSSAPRLPHAPVARD